MRLELGKHVRCRDGSVHELADVVIDASSNRVTHLVVQPRGEPDEARLVPMELTRDDERAKDDTPGQEIRLRCTAETLKQLEPVRQHAYLHAGEHTEKSSKWDVGVEDIQAVPQYRASVFGEYGGDPLQEITVTYDRVPKGEIELRHASDVYSSDDHHMGRVDGAVVDARDTITHLLLERGHLWWRREIAIPATAISKLENDMVTLGVPKQEVDALPSERRR